MKVPINDSGSLDELIVCNSTYNAVKKNQRDKLCVQTRFSTQIPSVLRWWRATGTVIQRCHFKSSQNGKCQHFPPQRKAALVFFLGEKKNFFIFPETWGRVGVGLAHVRIGHECVNPIQQISKFSVKAQIANILVGFFFFFCT